ncbi:SDR family oxidoreductase [Candidimonas humi]|jgi:3-oxoacyl-[acyl-carrier protein] reductase|uniref:SDR family oxidoreductase n=1 Tax=Candidimonas humi TaxID=683355 RepID=A0ABV8NWK5_9BURK|nr:SDR family oxidoreductase [Candidimonas humi]MBV6303340.1 SDR family oxidoreductase [Candidimonas humi]
MDYGIHGRTALVLGAGGGLGSAVCLALAREGVNIAAADVNADALQATREKLAGLGVKVLAREWDLADIGSQRGHLDAIEREIGSIDILFNNTGGPAPSPAYQFDAATLAGQFQSMVASVMALTSLVLPGMRERKWGRIITSASSGVVAPIPNLAVSNSLRLALVGWAKTLAREVAADGVTVNIAIPGRIATARVKFLDESKATRQGVSVENVTAESLASIPMARYGEPGEYANAIAFLASAGASYVTGSQIRVDGGLLSNI